MHPVDMFPAKHLGLDGECPVHGSHNPVTARPIHSVGVAQISTAELGLIIAGAVACPGSQTTYQGKDRDLQLCNCHREACALKQVPHGLYRPLGKCEWPLLGFFL